MTVEELSHEVHDQNLHPNIYKRQELEESKLEVSALRHSNQVIPALKDNYQTPNKNVDDTRERNYRGVVHSNIKNSGDRNQKIEHLDASYQPSPIEMKNAYADNYDISIDDQSQQEELKLNILQRLAHEKWKYRANAYKEIAQEFYQASQGQKHFLTVLNNEREEYNPFDKFQEWLLRMIRDTNLVAKSEGLKTLLVYCQLSPDIK